MNTLKVNKNLIQGIASKKELETLDLLQLEEPDLPILSPLAKAAYKLSRSGDLSADEAAEALSTVFIVAGEDTESLLSGESINTLIEEHVEHQITTKTGSSEATIHFSSRGSICDYPYNSDAWCSLEDLTLEKLCGKPLSPKQLETMISERISSGRPQCFPCDSDFIGSITYELIRVNDIPTKPLTVTDHCHSFELSDPEFIAEDTQRHGFHWTRLLREDQLRKLGLDQNRSTVTPEEWIDRSQLIESYQQGELKKVSFDSYILCLGCGPDWSPCCGIEDECSTELLEDPNADIFPPNHAPILAYRWNTYSSDFEEKPLGAMELLGALLTAKEQ